MVDYKILAVDDDPAALEAAVDHLRAHGHEVHAASSVEEAEELLHRESYHLVLTDLVLPGRNGLDLTRIVRENLPQAAVVVVTGHATLETAVEALKSGASDYLEKPVDPRELEDVVTRLLSTRPRHVPNRLLTESAGPVSFDGMVARSPVMRAVFEKIALAAGTDTPVLLRGETGTGKELAAASIHKRSLRSGGPFVPVHVAGVPAEAQATELFGHADRPGRIEEAEGGTLFLDGIEALDGRAQLGLMRLLEGFRYLRIGDTEERSASVRILASTSVDLGERVREGRFRQDLYYRLDIFPIDLPPLRDRRDDVAPLTIRIVEELSERYRRPMPVVPDDTLDVLARHGWPGNVRELRNVVERAFIACTGRTLGPDLLPSSLMGGTVEPDPIHIPVGTTMKDVERMVIAKTLDAHAWNKNRTAKILGISRRSLYNKLDRYNIVRAGAAPSATVSPAQPPPLPEVRVPPRRETRTASSF